MSASQIVGRSSSSHKGHSRSSLTNEPTYTDFLSGINGAKPPGSLNTGSSSYREANFQIPPSAAYHVHSMHKHSVRHPHHRHHGRHHHRHQNHSKTYGSEAGYRSECSSRSLGYESDAGYRSDQETVRRYQAMLGYTGDRDSSLNGNITSRSVGREGYASDYESYSSRGRNGRSYRSPYGGKSPQKASAMYTNVALSTRTTIRNDEMYEQQHKAKHKVAGSQDRLEEHKQRNSGRPECEQSRPSLRPLQASQSLDLETNGPPPTGSQSNLNGPLQGAAKSKDDDKWKEQLYQASVKLQKSPSDRRMRVRKPGQSPA